ncbi:hypothetical protein [Bremerella cremea]|uniref:hypothetical protein n=1 Tax=Bremerella cremea TaxID=1031537 RepID=UPI0031E6F2EB
MNWRSFPTAVSMLGLAAVALVIGSGCQPPAETPAPEDTPATTPGDEVENPSTVIDTDPDNEPMNVME